MKKKELEKRVKELESLVSEQKYIIELLKQEINNNQYIPKYPQPLDDYLKPPFIVECEHDYPLVWHGTVPPRCGKCGKEAPMLHFTYDSGTTPDYVHNPTITSGNILTNKKSNDLTFQHNSITSLN